ncbi:TonB-dependent receptor [Leptobacterium flavescens]|uniref:TonB-dependent receptor n=1 Tax=Leptobacterium flavescens TaxID=472055 RepID=A0A6P0UR93_9FLAO|nr:outer membrane beta-barrel family protein [Leptobacterium flavescens]NER15030.1 TonB-dependent receptor [Leptobacterium flavescens]
MKSLFFLLFFLLSISLFSQKTHLKGKVIDKQDQEPIAYATVTIYNGTRLIDGVSTDEEGNFQLKTTAPFTHLELSFLGYKSLKLPFSEIKDPLHLLFTLEVDINNLDEVVLKGERTLTRFKTDRKIINLGSDIQQSGVNALEAFDQIPEIQADIGTGTLSLRGNDNVRLLINGKPSSLNAVELLEQVPASLVESVEIITSPSVKYRADGLSGIINIKLKKQNDPGLSLGLNSSAGTGGRFRTSTDGNYRLPFANFRWSLSRAESDITNNQTIRRLFNDGNTENIFTPYKTDGLIYRISSGLDLFVKDRHEFSVEFNFTDDSHTSSNLSSYTDVTDRDDYEYLRESSHFHYITILNANYRLKFDKKDHFLELDYHTNISNNDYPIRDLEDGILQFDQFLTEDFVLQSIAADYKLPLNGKLLAEAGVVRSSQILDSRSLLDPSNGSASDNSFSYDEELWGIYGLLKLAHKNFTLQTGLRFEYFYSDSQIRAEGFRNKQKFVNLFPSFHFSYKINYLNTLNLSYSKRVSRPDFHQLNAFQIVSPLFIWEYNPGITPEFSDNIELSYQKNSKKLNLNLTVFYRHRKDVILWTESSENNRQVFRYENAGNFNSLGFESSFNYKIAPFWRSRLTSNYYYTKINRNINVSWHDLFSSNIQFKNTFNIGKRITADITYLYNFKQQRAFNFLAPRNRLDLAVQGSFFEKRLSTAFRLVDVLNRNVFENNSRSLNLSQHTVWDIELQRRNFLVSINYKLFESKLRSRNRKNRRYNEAPID